MKLVFIHGRAQEGKDPTILQSKWEATLQKGFDTAGLSWPEGLSVRFPFYGDLLSDLVAELESPLVEDVVTRGEAFGDDEADFRSEFINEIATTQGLSDGEIELAVSELTDTGVIAKGAVIEKGPLNWGWVQGILKALDRTPLGGKAIDAFTRDVYAYITIDAVRRRVDELIEASLPDEPYVIVGHSLGSVIGYNVLRHSDPSPKVGRYVTVGSPLGAKSIKKRLDLPLAMPSCTGSWFNGMDERDVVALHPLNETHFPISPPVENKTTIDNFTDNRHGIEGYLNDPDVALRIHEALCAIA